MIANHAARTIQSRGATRSSMAGATLAAGLSEELARGHPRRRRTEQAPQQEILRQRSVVRDDRPVTNEFAYVGVRDPHETLDSAGPAVEGGLGRVVGRADLLENARPGENVGYRGVVEGQRLARAEKEESIAAGPKGDQDMIEDGVKAPEMGLELVDAAAVRRPLHHHPAVGEVGTPRLV